jgi:hypothetical protein
MVKAVIAWAVLASVLVLGAATPRATALPIAPPVALISTTWSGAMQKVHYRRSWRREWAPREYWRWDHRPTWDDPWRVLKPTIWGSPEPHLVPAEIWARKWHLPRRYWLSRRRYWLHHQ